MPYATGQVHAEKTTKSKAEAQLRLLQGLEHAGIRVKVRDRK